MCISLETVGLSWPLGAIVIGLLALPESDSCSVSEVTESSLLSKDSNKRSLTDNTQKSLHAHLIMKSPRS